MRFGRRRVDSRKDASVVAHDKVRIGFVIVDGDVARGVSEAEIERRKIVVGIGIFRKYDGFVDGIPARNDVARQLCAAQKVDLFDEGVVGNVDCSQTARKASCDIEVLYKRTVQAESFVFRPFFFRGQIGIKLAQVVDVAAGTGRR